MKIRLTTIAVVLPLLLAWGQALAQSNAQPLPETKAQRDARMEWWREARFGLFIHWGVYAVPAGEWQGKTNFGEWFMEETKMPVSQYEQFAQQFNPVKFNARDWVRMAKDAGMKYLVITSKHHDGFAIYPSALTDWCIKNTPFQRDPLQELADACRQEGLRLCFYHSIMDWHHPDWGTRRPWHDKATGKPDMDAYVAFMKGQLKELITRYGPLGVMWFDGEWEAPWTHERGVDLYNYVRSLQPDIIINNRVGKGRAGMSGMDEGKGVGDFGTPEQEIPPTGFGSGVDWESCMTMNNHWGYNQHDQRWKSTQVLVRNLIDCASKGGNYLLNVGPTAEGLFPEASVQRLAEMGRWMKVNQEAIYGTSATPFRKLDWGRCTRKGNTLFLHVFNWPADQTLRVPMVNSVKKAYLLAEPSRALKAETTEQGVLLGVPQACPDTLATVIAVEIEGEPQTVKAANIGVGAKPVATAEVILDGSREMLDEKWTYWEGPGFKSSLPIKWKIVDDPVDVGTVVMSDDPAAAGGKYGSADIVTKKAYRDFRLHIEFLVMKPRGNSGVYLQNRYEIQVLDGDKTKHGMGAVINETESPYHAYNGVGKWNSYDIVFRAARFRNGKRVQKAMLTMYFNGIKVHSNQTISQVWGGPNSGIDGGNDGGKGITDTPGGLKLQAEGHDVRYRNTWIQELNLREADTDF